MIEALPPARAGLASGLGNTARQAGIAAGVALLGAIFRANAHGVPDPSSLFSGHAANTHRTHAVAAFADGLDAVMLVAAIVAVAGAVSALFVRGAPAHGRGELRPEPLSP
jgi:hypothetical protein